MSRRHLLVVLLAAAAFFGWAHLARAAVTVTRFDDPAGSGTCPTDCSLRQAIADAPNFGNEVDLPPGDYVLSQPFSPTSGLGGALSISTSISIVGEGSTSLSTVISGDYANGFNDRLMSVSGETASPIVRNLSFVGGLTTSGDGGAIMVDNIASLELDDVTFDANSATDGGALYLGPEAGTVNATGVTFTANLTTEGVGSAVLIDGGTLNLTNATVVGGNQGGIENSSGFATLTNVTIDGNTDGGLDSTSDLAPATTTITDTIVADGCLNTSGIVSGGGSI